MRVVVIIVLALYCFTPASGAQAHGSGASFEQEVGVHIIDIGYEPEKLVEGGSLLLDLSLLNAADRSVADFSRVWVRVEGEESGVLLATGIARAELGPTTVLLHTPTAESLTVHARFERGRDALAEAQFPLSAFPDQNRRSATPWSLLFIAATIGAALGALGVFLASAKKSKNI